MRGVLFARRSTAAIEAGAGTFTMPWHRAHGALHFPRNVATGKTYQGIDILALWVAAERRGYTSPIRGTFKQWLDAGYPVRNGEKSVTGVFYNDLAFTEENADTGESVDRKIGMVRAFPLFNCAQVEGFAASEEETFTPASFDTHARVDALITSSGIDIVYGGDRAFDAPGPDRVTVSDKERFTGSGTMTAAEAFEATRLHEMVHGSGGEKRLSRVFCKRFGDKADAFEELIAELGAAYLCAQLGVTPIARPDHAQYLGGWLAAMKEDKKAIFTAAGQAQRAATFLMGFAPSGPNDGLDPSRPMDTPADHAPPDGAEPS